MGFAQIILEEKWQREQKVTRVYVENAPSEYRNIFFAWLGKIFAILMTKHYLLLKKKGGGEYKRANNFLSFKDKTCEIQS